MSTGPARDDAPDGEAAAVRERYARRAAQDPRYDLRNPAALAAWQEREHATLALFQRLGLGRLSTLRLLEVGCGSGSHLLNALIWGFAPEHLQGIELLAERFEAARALLPPAVQLIQGDATQARIEAGSQDIVFQSTVFSSLLDDAFQQRLADAMWRWVRPGGGVLWYDFTVNNPRNADVRGVPLARVRQLFPHAQLTAQRITLAPPIARAACRAHPGLYTAFNALPPLRTHVLAWLAKPSETSTP
jgi:SAM-dependent methyltransferase